MDPSESVDFLKGGGLVPAIIQDSQTLEVLMMGYMNQDAYDQTRSTNLVCFYSRSKKRLWTKGEESGNILEVVSIHLDCDQDTVLVMVKPKGNTCHTGNRSCFNTSYGSNFILQLEQIIDERYQNSREHSYVNKLKNKGLAKIAQKVGEEGVETVIAALVEDEAHFIEESADLIFHLLVLLRAKNQSLTSIAGRLESRHQE